MTDLEIVKKCAEKMGLTQEQRAGFCESPYDPLHDDKQAMALVKRFDLCLEPNSPHFAKWAVWPMNDDRENRAIAHNHDLNRAICECVARLPD